MKTTTALFSLMFLAVACNEQPAAPPPQAAAPAPEPAAAPAPAAAPEPPQAAAGGEIDTSMPGDPEAGKETFDTICMACHGADGKGNGGVTAANFIGEPERLAKDNKVLLNSITNGITNGSRIMPPHKDTLTEQQIKDALSYVRKNFGTAAAK